MNELFNISGKTVVMTGATGILGSCISRYLAHEGAIMIIMGRNHEHGNSLVKDITEAGSTALFLPCDVLDRPSLERCRDTVLKQYGRIDVLINAAGGNMPGATIPTDKTFFDMSTEDFKKVVDLNLLGTVLPTQVFAEDMPVPAGCPFFSPPRIPPPQRARMESSIPSRKHPYRRIPPDRVPS